MTTFTRIAVQESHEEASETLSRLSSLIVSSRKSCTVIVRFVVTCMAVLLFLSSLVRSLYAPTCHDDRSVYVYGGGFSGFWYTLGQLSSMEDPTAPLYCFSSGCLVATAAVFRHQAMDVLQMAQSVQDQWKSGHISQFEMVDHFVQDLIAPKKQIQQEQREQQEQRSSCDVAITTATTSRLPLGGNWTTVANLSTTTLQNQTGCSTTMNGNGKRRDYHYDNYDNNSRRQRRRNEDHEVDLSRLHIITSRGNWWNLLEAQTHTPTDLESLRTLLLQTTWIPFATGWGLFHQGHMDGGLTLMDHPYCSKTAGVYFHWDILLNFLNMNLHPDRALEFFQRGLTNKLTSI